MDLLGLASTGDKKGNTREFTCVPSSLVNIRGVTSTCLTRCKHMPNGHGRDTAQATHKEVCTHIIDVHVLLSEGLILPWDLQNVLKHSVTGQRNNWSQHPVITVPFLQPQPETALHHIKQKTTDCSY
jgi:hypothetical protein